MHHLARRTSLVGRQPEALRRGGGEEEGGGGGGGEGGGGWRALKRRERILEGEE